MRTFWKRHYRGLLGVIVCLALAWAGLTLIKTKGQPGEILDYTVEIYLKDKDGKPTGGSGTVIGHGVNTFGSRTVARSYILTNEHVVEGADEVTVRWRDTSYVGEVSTVDKMRDLAIVEVFVRLPAAPMYLGDVAAGERELVVGNPFGNGLLITEGFVGGVIQRYAHDVPVGPAVREGSASVYWGNSGGGLYVDRGGYVLVGIVTAVKSYPTVSEDAKETTSHTLSVASTVQFSIQMKDVRTFLVENGFLDE